MGVSGGWPLLLQPVEDHGAIVPQCRMDAGAGRTGCICCRFQRVDQQATAVLLPVLAIGLASRLAGPERPAHGGAVASIGIADLQQRGLIGDRPMGLQIKNRTALSALAPVQAGWIAIVIRPAQRGIGRIQCQDLLWRNAGWQQ